MGQQGRRGLCLFPTIDDFGALQSLSNMAKEIPSAGDLPRRSEITDAEIQAVAEAYLRDEGAKPLAF